VEDAELSGINVTGFSGALLGIVNVTGTGLEGATAIAAPVDPAPGNARAGRPGAPGLRGENGGGAGDVVPAANNAP
jgi:hypothetical protein